MGVLYKLAFPNGKEYIGITRQGLQVRLKEHAKAVRSGKGHLLHRAWREHGFPRVQVLAVVENACLAETEIRAIQAFNTKHPGGYNLTDGGEGVVGLPCSEETKQKLRAANLGKRHSEESRLRLSLALRGRICRDDTRAKISAANTGRGIGRFVSEETRKKLRQTSSGRTHSVSDAAKLVMREAKLGGKLSDEHKKNIGLRSLGRRMSEENRKKMSEVHSGRVFSEEHRQKLRAAKLGKPISEETKAKRAATRELNKVKRQNEKRP